MKLFAILLSILTLQCYAQEWESIETPISTNGILFDIDFPGGQGDIGYVGASSATFNGQGAIMKTDDNGTTWEVIWIDELEGSGVTSLHFFNPLIGMVGRMDGMLMTTIDGGGNWTEMDIAPGVDQGEIRSIDFYDNLNGAMLTAWEGIYVTSDGGANWTQASTNYLGGQGLSYVDANTLVACGGEQRIYRSTDAGMTWAQVFQGPNGNMQWVNLGIGFYDDMHGLVTSEEGQIFITADGGSTWTSDVVDNQFGLMRGVHYVTADEVYISATPGAVYVSQDAGQNWILDSPVDFDPSYYDILFTANGTGFVCGSGSTGGTEYLRKLPVIDGVDEFEVKALTLHPNPAVDIIRVNTDAIAGAAWMKIYNSIGELVLEGSLNNGQVDVSTLASGQYLLRLTDAEGSVFVGDLVVRR